MVPMQLISPVAVLVAALVAPGGAITPPRCSDGVHGLVPGYSKLSQHTYYCAESSLFDELHDVIDALPKSVGDTFGSDYKSQIDLNAGALQSLGQSGSASSQTDRAVLACQASTILFGDEVVTPHNISSYKQEQQENWSETCWLPAACFIKVRNTVDTALALKVVTFLQATFAVRSAGHNPSPGFSSVGESGVLLDMGGLNDFELSQKHDVASLGPGLTWDEVYKQLEKNELTAVGGRVAGVGVGGLLLGGGMSHFSNHWGMACDNVQNYEVVLANSTVVQANAHQNPDLFRALKGGGPNFGIVTRFDVYTYPDYQLWFTYRTYNSTDADRVMKAAVEVEKAMVEDDRVGFFLIADTGSLTAGMLYRGWTTFPDAFHAFDGIEPLMTVVPPTNGTQFSVASASALENIAKREIGSVSVETDGELYVELNDVLQNMTTDPAYSMVFVFQPIAAPAVKKGEEHGGNSLNISPRSQSWLAVTTEWTDNSLDEFARSQTRQLTSGLRSTAASRGLLMDFLYMNDASQIQSPIKSYGSKSVAFLKQTSQKYDPAGVFQQLQNAGFLLSDL